MSEVNMSEEKGARLREWQRKYQSARDEYQAQIAKMDEREKWYNGDQDRVPIFRGDGVTNNPAKDIPYLRNICAEMIEDQVDSTIPMPKVTARRKEDEGLARLIENMLRNKLDLLPFEMINDLMERTVPIQGGAAYLVEWDSTVRVHDVIGELCVSPVHPKRMIPQPGVVTSIADMDYIFLEIPSTKSAVERRYGVILENNVSEEVPEARGSSGEEKDEEDLVTVIAAYFRNSSPDKPGIGKFSWCLDTVLENYDDYQARRIRRCARCGAPEGVRFGAPNAPTRDLASAMGLGAGLSDPGLPGEEEDRAAFGISRYEKVEEGVCPVCGSSEFTDSDEDYEEIWETITLPDGRVIPGVHPEEVTRVGEDGVEETVIEMRPTRIPYFKPSKYPLALQRNVSVFGKLLGDSDIDKLKSPQNALNRVNYEAIDKMMHGGSFVVLPPDTTFSEQGGVKIVRPAKPEAADRVRAIDLQQNIGQNMEFAESIYKSAQQAIGVTDAFLGRRDPTATSGKAKELSAAQAAGRMSSKRAMKRAAFAELLELMFLFTVAYADEPFPVLSKDANGNAVYDSFSRYLFLENDPITGEWRWNTAFLFDCDESSALASNREAMWQELRMNLQTGAFGNPQDPATLVLFWGMMEENHYPGAGQIKKKFEEMQAQAAAAAEAQALQAAAASGAVPGAMPTTGTAPVMPAGTVM